MLGKLILLFVLVPLLDMIALAILSSYIGWPISVGLVILSGIVGAILAKLSFKYVMYRFSREALSSRLPDVLTDGAMIFFAAGLLLTPGFLTDFFGLSILVPACRRVYKRLIARWLGIKFTATPLGSFTSQFTQHAEFSTHRHDVGREEEGVLEGEVVQPPRHQPNSLESSR